MRNWILGTAAVAALFTASMADAQIFQRDGQLGSRMKARFGRQQECCPAPTCTPTSAQTTTCSTVASQPAPVETVSYEQPAEASCSSCAADVQATAITYAPQATPVEAAPVSYESTPAPSCGCAAQSEPIATFEANTFTAAVPVQTMGIESTSSCSSCQAMPVTYAQPIETGCSSCATSMPVSYEQPISYGQSMSYEQPISYGQTISGCSSCGQVVSGGISGEVISTGVQGCTSGDCGGVIVDGVVEGTAIEAPTEAPETSSDATESSSDEGAAEEATEGTDA